MVKIVCFILFNFYHNKKKSIFFFLKRDFSGGPVIKTPCFQCRGPGFDPWSGKYIPHAQVRVYVPQPKKKKKKKKPNAAKINKFFLKELLINMGDKAF